MSTARSRSKESRTIASPAFVFSCEVGPAVSAEPRQGCVEIVSDAKFSLLAEMDILREEIEGLRALVIPMIFDLMTRLQAPKDSNIQAGTADEQHNKEIKGLRRDVNGL